jgi:hypothetical protein
MISETIGGRFSIRFSSFKSQVQENQKWGVINLLVEVTLNSMEEKAQDFCPIDVQELGLGSLECVLWVKNMCLKELNSIYSTFSMMYKNLY